MLFIVYTDTPRDSFLAAKYSIAKLLKLWIVFISSLWIEKTAEGISLSCAIRFREMVLMRFKVLKHLSEYAENIGVGYHILETSHLNHCYVKGAHESCEV